MACSNWNCEENTCWMSFMTYAFFGRIMTMARWRNSFASFSSSHHNYSTLPYSSGSCIDSPCTECAKWASISSTSLRLRAVSSWSSNWSTCTLSLLYATSSYLNIIFNQAFRYRSIGSPWSHSDGRPSHENLIITLAPFLNIMSKEYLLWFLEGSESRRDSLDLALVLPESDWISKHSLEVSLSMWYAFDSKDILDCIVVPRTQDQIVWAWFQDTLFQHPLPIHLRNDAFRLTFARPFLIIHGVSMVDCNRSHLSAPLIVILFSELRTSVGELWAVFLSTESVVTDAIATFEGHMGGFFVQQEWLDKGNHVNTGLCWNLNVY